ncbi:uncharacterized protein MONBRDRAFT_32082 [Monosiga brevicollis MX1]|uniref:BUB1 N-terminal domain-containing protein n=1 Tax=Monosiga brevicollis TaxID=81824 RepID=A9UXA7_MONBE|nr:uncharacterized protein MONBRDRAFT_32082 [Monosiga brevicollis MX1]EDQ90356.1 predicted protein [Monosiga brevicollis MX1]|eukprot:XP_001745123.1 hypothetical protein [Monosiga brevicollis MX1]
MALNTSEWENIKENAQPLRKGYRAAQLLQAQDRSSSHTWLENEKARFEAEINAGTGDDPLQPWISYLKWTEEHAALGDVKVNRTSVLERCVRKFATLLEYHDDPRYIDICFQYADVVEDPRDMIKFMRSKRIGVATVLFWNNYARILESLERPEEALAVFDQGLPFMTDDESAELLRQKQMECALRIEDTATRATLLGRDQPEEDLSQRQHLGDLRANKHGHVASNRVTALSGHTRGLGGASAAPASNNTGSLQIFSDNGSAPAGAQVSAEQGWRQMPVQSVTRKENSLAAGIWTDRGLQGAKSMVRGAGGAGPSLAVLADPVEAGQRGSPPRKQSKAMKNALKPKKDLAALEANPFVELQRRRAQSAQEEGVVLAYDAAAIFPPMAEEDCTFEELRANMWLQANQLSWDMLPVPSAPVYHDEEATADVDMEEDAGDVESSLADASLPLPPHAEQAPAPAQNMSTILEQTEESISTERGALRPRRALGVLRDQPTDATLDREDHTVTKQLDFNSASLQATPATRSEETEASAAAENCPSPTINTKAAMADIMAMFGAPLEGNTDTPATESPVQTAAAPAAGGFQIFCDENAAPAATLTERFADENAFPLGASEEQGAQHNEPRSVLGELKSFSTTPFMVYNDDGTEANADDDGENDAHDHHNITVAAPSTESITHSTPFVRPNAAAELALPCATPIPAEHGDVGTDLPHQTMLARQHGLHLAEMDDHHLSPIVEASQETSTSSSFTSNHERGAPEHPLPLAFKQALVENRHADWASSPWCQQLPAPCPRLGLNQVLKTLLRGKTLKVVRPIAAEAEGLQSFLAREVPPHAADTAGFDDEDDDEVYTYHLLKQTQSSYEAVVTRRLLSHVEQDRRLSLCYGVTERAFQFADGLVLCCRASDEGTLQDVVQLAANSPAGLDETLAIYYAVELLRAVEGMHGAGVVHGSLQPSNIYLRNDAEDEDGWQKEWRADGSNGWADRGLLLANFTAAFSTVDENQVRSLVPFFSALQKQLRRPALGLDLDYLGLANTMHWLLYGTEMSLALTEDGFMPATPFKAAWVQPLWQRFFHELINNTAVDLKSLRLQFEQHLAVHPFKANALRSLLTKQEICLFDLRD